MDEVAPEYTIAICNYNMADTLEESLRSRLDQIDERFEVLVIDDGSTDGSQEILQALEEEYNKLRCIEGDNNNIGEARHFANQNARGSHIITQSDADDRLDDFILEAISVYEKIQEASEKPLYINFSSLEIAPKQLLLNVPYRSIGRGEDLDLWRRLYSREKIIFIKSRDFEYSIGYDRGKIESLKTSLEKTHNEIKTGVSLKSYIWYKMHNIEVIDDYFRILMAPIYWLKTKTSGQMQLPKEVRKKGVIQKEISNLLGKEELEDQLGITITDQERKIFE